MEDRRILLRTQLLKQFTNSFFFFYRRDFLVCLSAILASGFRMISHVSTCLVHLLFLINQHFLCKTILHL